MSTNSAVSRCFSRLPIPATAQNIFFGRIKNFTNVAECKPIIQSLNKLKIKITDRQGSTLSTKLMNNTSTGDSKLRSVQLTFAITYQTKPNLFDN